MVNSTKKTILLKNHQIQQPASLLDCSPATVLTDSGNSVYGVKGILANISYVMVSPADGIIADSGNWRGHAI